TADYLITGVWSSLAHQEAKKYCAAHCVATGENNQFTQIPLKEEWSFTIDSPYLHYTDNETIQGLEFHTPPKCEGKWLISDMTSNILCKPIQFDSYGAIYASAQKNLGIAGITVVIVRKELIGKAHPFTPSTLDYQCYLDTDSMYNTPPVFCWYVLGLVLKWTKSQGTIEDISRLCDLKSRLLYEIIDGSDFYSSPVFKEHRSRVNIPFKLPSAQLESLFINQANEHGIKQIKGHKIVGGCRASLYNAMPLEGVKALSDFMKHFEKTHG
ncbi:MAG: 3-phosphoserine/phosphohydroxythreonine transaminase, partial [Candidatus Berkiella sp.]